MPPLSWRRHLPQLGGEPFITDGGMETTLIFENGLELPHFAAFVLLDDPRGLEALEAYYRSYLALASENGVGIILDTPTWRASADWGDRLGYSAEALADINRRGIAVLEGLRQGRDAPPVVISGAVGPRGDGYRVEDVMEPDEAERYHSAQIRTFAETSADLVTGLTLTYAAEAIGIVRAAREADIPAVISFTVETDGHLPDGQPLGDAVAAVDAATDESAAYFMINCAHPLHFEGVLEGEWLERLRGLRANASSKSHAELDEAAELDTGDPEALAVHYAALRGRLPGLTVMGGCCGTDTRHIGEICSVALPSGMRR